MLDKICYLRHNILVISCANFQVLLINIVERENIIFSTQYTLSPALNNRYWTDNFGNNK